MGRCSGWHLYGVLADFFDRASFNWYAITSIATLLMTLFIQRSEHRDTQVIQAKLDELLRMKGAQAQADGGLRPYP
jgi:low affinity Fe/Cu permease